MRFSRTEGMAMYDNNVTKAIDEQLIVAPQYGIMGTPPKFDPPPQASGKRKNNRFLRRDRSSQSIVRQQRTKDLKMCIAILEAELALAASGKLEVGSKTQQAMEARLKLMRAEKTRRDLRDLANGKTAPTRSFFSIGARVARAA